MLNFCELFATSRTTQLLFLFLKKRTKFFSQRGDRIEQSVTRMMTIIDLARNIRERHNKPLKTPLRLSLSLVASALL
jgi:hypothetical protein